MIRVLHLKTLTLPPLPPFPFHPDLYLRKLKMKSLLKLNGILTLQRQTPTKDSNVTFLKYFTASYWNSIASPSSPSGTCSAYKCQIYLALRYNRSLFLRIYFRSPSLIYFKSFSTILYTCSSICGLEPKQFNYKRTHCANKGCGRIR